MRNTRCKQLILDGHLTLCLLFVSKSDVTPTVSVRQAFSVLSNFLSKQKEKKKKKEEGEGDYIFFLKKKKKEKKQ